MKLNCLIAMLLSFVLATDTFSRGFGGFHGGGFGGGGGGGFDRGGFGGGGGGFDRGGFGGGGFDHSGFGGGGFGGGSFDRGGFNGGFDRGGGEFGGFGGGNRNAAGGSSFGRGFGDAGSQRPTSEGFGNFGGERGTTANQFDRSAFSANGFRYSDIGRAFNGDRFDEHTLNPNAFRTAPSAARLDSFLGLPTDLGMSHGSAVNRSAEFAGNARGISAKGLEAAGERGARGTVVKGPDGTVVAHGATGERGAVGGAAVRGDNVNAFARANSVTHQWSSADMRLQGNYARTHFNHWNTFDHNWYRRYPNAWWASGFAAGFWSGASWASINNWFGQDWPVVSYSYGNNIWYGDGNVYLDDQPIATTADYYQSAVNLAQQGQQANIPSEPPPANLPEPSPQNAQWLPLGVFEVLREGEKTSDMTLQLAVNKAGIIRGNYFDSADKDVQQVDGSVDKKTQRVAWVIGDKKNIIFDTGLYNLTQNETTVLVHMSKDKTEQWMLVRLKQDTANSAATSESK